VTKISIIALFLWLVAIIGVVLGSFIPALAPPATYHIDLYIHFSAYGLLAGLPMFITHSLKWRSFSIVLMIAFGIGVEWVQSFVPGRSGSIDDVVVNLIGIALGTVIAGALSHRIAWHFDTVRMNEERLLARSGTITTPN
jgi:VanZ family protein